MFQFLRKPYRWAATYTTILAIITGLILLDTFVIPRAGSAVAGTAAGTTGSTTATTTLSAGTDNAADQTSGTAGATISATSYEDENIKIGIEAYYEYDTWIYVADIRVTRVDYLKTAFAQGTYGRNIKAATSDMAVDNGAILAINGDYYGFRNDGFVLRNGVLYRDIASPVDSDEALLISGDGSFSIIRENGTDAESLLAAGAWQILSFGPALISDDEILVDQGSEVDQSMTSNPRTAVGMISPLHYVFIISDGRTDESAGLSLLELAGEFAERGCCVAYNLDGGGSTTLWFNGEIINSPVGGRGSSERKVSDIVYIGY